MAVVWISRIQLMSVTDGATNGDLRVDFWIGDVLSEAVDSYAFVGMPLDLVMDEIESVYHLTQEAIILVNDKPVSRRDYHLELGDNVTLILSSHGSPNPNVNPEATVTPDPGLQFEFDGATWHLKFGVETGQFTRDMDGFRLYGALLKKPDTDLMSHDLEKEAGLGRAITEEGGQGRADTAIDPAGLKGIREQLQKLQHEIDDTVNEERIAELEQQKQDLLAYRDKVLDRHGRPRAIGAANEFEKARMRVRNSLDRARDLIAKSMPAFAKYLENTIKYNSPYWSYRPSRNPSVRGGEPPRS
jgi:hypothetical protein